MSRKVLLDSDVGGCRGGSPRRCLLESSPCIFFGGVFLSPLQVGCRVERRGGRSCFAVFQARQSCSVLRQCSQAAYVHALFKNARTCIAVNIIVEFPYYIIKGCVFLFFLFFFA